jgi:hypothetical protein
MTGNRRFTTNPNGWRTQWIRSRRATVQASATAQRRRFSQVLPPGEDLVHRGLLPRQADAITHLGSPTHHVKAGHFRPATVGPEQRGQYSHSRRLPGAVRAEQPAHRSLQHGKVEPIKGSGLAVPLG